MKLDQKTLSHNVLVAWAIIEKIEAGKKYILIQTRRKPWTEYHDTIEFPVWWIDKREFVLNWLIREVQEETRISVTHINAQHKRTGKNSMWLFPFYVTQQLSEWLPWVMLWFVCRWDGVLFSQQWETKDPRWVTIDELESIVKEEKIFDLQKPFFDYYLANHETVVFQEL